VPAVPSRRSPVIRPAPIAASPNWNPGLFLTAVTGAVCLGVTIDDVDAGDWVDGVDAGDWVDGVDAGDCSSGLGRTTHVVDAAGDCSSGFGRTTHVESL
jgi:hypothetical protein